MPCCCVIFEAFLHSTSEMDTILTLVGFSVGLLNGSGISVHLHANWFVYWLVMFYNACSKFYGFQLDWC